MSKWLVMGNPGSTFEDTFMVNQYPDAEPDEVPNNNGSGSFSVYWYNHN